MTMVLNPVTRAQPSIEGMIAGRSPTVARPSMRPVKSEPMMDQPPRGDPGEKLVEHGWGRLG